MCFTGSPSICFRRVPMTEVAKFILIALSGIGRAVNHILDTDGDLDEALKRTRQDELANRAKNDARLRKPRP